MSTALSNYVLIWGRFNSAIICEYFMTELSDKVENIDRFNSNLTNKINKILEKRPEDIVEF